MFHPSAGAAAPYASLVQYSLGMAGQRSSLLATPQGFRCCCQRVVFCSAGFGQKQRPFKPFRCDNSKIKIPSCVADEPRQPVGGSSLDITKLDGAMEVSVPYNINPLT
uniref:Uncharacterized protein n=1 Tax=Oryza meridionalis TaxID=40149 RepID=A0A0E0EG91_9ORYZ